jgi:sialidase-1
MAGAWLFDEGSGTTANDLSGHGNHGSIVADGWLSGASCHAGACLPFSAAGVMDGGAPEGVTVPYGAALKFGTGDFTVSAWVSATTSGLESVVVGANECFVNESWLLSLQSGVPGFATFGAGSSGGYIKSASAILDGAWHHLAARRTGTQLELIVDGTVVANAPIAASYNSDSAAPSLVIGNINGCTGLDFTGSIDSVQIYSRALSLTELQGI